MPASTIAAQLYTLRDFTKTPADIISTFRKVKKIGYDAVQASALGKIEPKELAKILKDEGLVCCATHGSAERMKNETAQVIEEHNLWDCKYTAIGGFWPPNPTTQDWLAFAQDYNAIAEKFKASGIRIGYHNHSHELVRYDNQPALQILIDKLNTSVWMEVDTYWITHGGGDPAAWIGKVKGRIPCVHLKDMAMSRDKGQLMAEVGEGNLNWPAILEACKQAGVEWYIVEQDVCQRDPFESLAISLRNLKGMGID